MKREKHADVIRKYVLERVGYATDLQGTRRVTRLVGGLAWELEPLEHAFNVTTRDEPPVPVILGMEHRGIVLVHALLDDEGEGQDDRIESVWLGALEVTLRRVRVPEGDLEDAHVTGIAVEHDRLPGGGLDVEVAPYRQSKASEAFEELRRLLEPGDTLRSSR